MTSTVQARDKLTCHGIVIRRFDFTILIPSTLPVHNSHKFLCISTCLYAVVEGLPLPDSVPGDAPGSSNKGKDAESDDAARSQGRFGSLIPRGPASWLGPRRKSSAQSPSSSSTRTNAQKQDATPGNKFGRMPSPPPPPEDSTPELRRIQSPDGQPVNHEWLLGDHKAQRALRTIRNPDPDGGYSVLNEHAKGFVKGLGAYDIRCWSDIVGRETLKCFT